MAKKGKTYLTREVVVTPKGNYTIPSLEAFKDQKAFNARQHAAEHIQRQKAPNVPIVPSRAPWSIVAAIMGMSDQERIKMFGTADVQTCIYTATSQYKDKYARVSGNKTFRENPERYGFTEVPMDSAQVGDLIQLTDFAGTPYHSTILTDKTKTGDLYVSYSNGHNEPYDVYEGDTIWTMKKNRPIEVFTGTDGFVDGDTPAAFRYQGSPGKQSEWTQEYINKYGLRKEDYFQTPTMPTYTEQPDALRIQKPLVKAKGGFLQPRDAWDKLSIPEKAEMMKVAVSHGIYNLSDIRQKYNEFALGGDTEEASVSPNEAARMGAMVGAAIAARPKGYIGGSTSEAREKYWKTDNEMRMLTDSVANQYGISPDLLRTRMDNEGYTDARINEINKDVKEGTNRALMGTALFNSQAMPYIAGSEFGLDDVATYINNGTVNLINENWGDGQFQNEKGRWTRMAMGHNYSDNIGIMAATLKALKDIARKDFPNASDADLDRYASAYYNRGIKGGRDWVKRGAKGYKVNKHSLGGPLIDAVRANFYSGETEGTQQMISKTATPEENVFSGFIVESSKDPMVILAKQNPEYKDTLAKIYDSQKYVNGPELLTKDQATRLLEVYNYAGRPKMKPLSEGNDRAEIKYKLFGRPTVFLNTEPQEGLDDLISELAHPIQNQYGNNKRWKERLNLAYHPDDFRGKTNYDFPNRSESETHEDFQPLLEHYIFNNALPGQQYITYNDEGLLGNDSVVYNPKFIPQVTDSARVYNKRKQDVNYQYKRPRGERKQRNKIISFFGDLF